jgi:CBS domain-containing protein
VKISDILRIKGDTVHTVRPDTTVLELLETMVARNIGACVITTGGELPHARMYGIVSERDVVVGLALRGAELLAAPVSSIATVHVHTTEPEATIEAAMEIMTRRRVRHLPVLADGELAGIVSLGDLVARRLDELEEERRHLTAYISSGG